MQHVLSLKLPSPIGWGSPPRTALLHGPSANGGRHVSVIHKNWRPSLLDPVIQSNQGSFHKAILNDPGPLWFMKHHETKSLSSIIHWQLVYPVAIDKLTLALLDTNYIAAKQLILQLDLPVTVTDPNIQVDVNFPSFRFTRSVKGPSKSTKATEIQRKPSKRDV